MAPRTDSEAPNNKVQERLHDSLQEIFASHDGGQNGVITARQIASHYRSAIAELFEQNITNKSATLLAVGGFGRGDMAPHSDIDLVVLTPRGAKSLEEQVKKFAYAVWDLGVELHHSVRTEEQCLELAEADAKVFTSLLESSVLAGDKARGKAFQKRLRKSLLNTKAKVRRYIESRLRAFHARHERFGSSIFLLEPHIKEGQGGLRDLCEALWVARAAFQIEEIEDLWQGSFVHRTELNRLMNKHLHFLWKLRHQMHLTSKRAQDILTFAMQEELAKAFGYTGDDPARELMSDYYDAARGVRRICLAVIEHCVERRTPVKRGESPDGRKLDNTFVVKRGKIHFARGAKRRLEHGVKAFLHLQNLKLPLGEPVKAFIRTQVEQKPGALAKSRRAQKSLLEIIHGDGHVHETLLAMHGVGVLVELLPEFKRIECLAQRDLYHIYTVDVHSLFVLKHLEMFREGALQNKVPLLAQLREMEHDWPLLFLAALLHDVGKGSGKNHELIGEKFAKETAKRLGIESSRSRRLAFLVKNHLEMAMLSRKRDVNNPKVVEEFADQLGDSEMLGALTLLTLADQMSVGPKVASSWSTALLNELYSNTQHHLTERSFAQKAEKVKRDAAKKLGESRAAKGFLRQMPMSYFRVNAQREITKHFKLSRGLKSKPILGWARCDHKLGTTRIHLLAKDKPGIFRSFTGALAYHRLNILAAWIFSPADGTAFDVFQVEGRLRSTDAKFGALLETIEATLTEEMNLSDRLDAMLAKRTALTQKGVPKISTRIEVSNHEAEEATIIQVICRDRVALLYRIASSLAEMKMDVHLATVYTEGQRAIDSFHVTDEGGNKIEDESRLDAIKSRLIETLDN